MRVPPRFRRLCESSIHVDGVTYQHEWIRCGNPRCARRPCLHGPYWFAYFKTKTREKRGRIIQGKTRSIYIGRTLPASVIESFRAKSVDEVEVMREARRELRKRKREKSA